MSVRWACGERERAVDHPRRPGQRAAAPARRHAQHAAHERRTLGRYHRPLSGSAAPPRAATRALRRHRSLAGALPRGTLTMLVHERRTLEARCLVVGLRAPGRRQGDAELGEAVLDVHGPHERGAAGRPDRGEQRGWEAAAEHVCDDGRRRRRRASFQWGEAADCYDVQHAFQ